MNSAILNSRVLLRLYKHGNAMLHTNYSNNSLHKRRTPRLYTQDVRPGAFHMGLRLCSDDRPRAKPSGFRAPTTVRGRNPQGSELRRPSEGKTLRVHGSDDRTRETLSSSRSLVSLLLRPPRWFAAQGVAAISDRQPYDASPPRVLEHHVKNKIDEK